MGNTTSAAQVRKAFDDVLFSPNPHDSVTSDGSPPHVVINETDVAEDWPGALRVKKMDALLDLTMTDSDVDAVLPLRTIRELRHSHTPQFAALVYTTMAEVSRMAGRRREVNEGVLLPADGDAAVTASPAATDAAMRSARSDLSIGSVMSESNDEPYSMGAPRRSTSPRRRHHHPLQQHPAQRLPRGPRRDLTLEEVKRFTNALRLLRRCLPVALEDGTIALEDETEMEGRTEQAAVPIGGSHTNHATTTNTTTTTTINSSNTEGHHTEDVRGKGNHRLAIQKTISTFNFQQLFFVEGRTCDDEHMEQRFPPLPSQNTVRRRDTKSVHPSTKGTTTTTTTTTSDATTTSSLLRSSSTSAPPPLLFSSHLVWSLVECCFIRGLTLPLDWTPPTPTPSMTTSASASSNNNNNNNNNNRNSNGAGSHTVAVEGDALQLPLFQSPPPTPPPPPPSARRGSWQSSSVSGIPSPSSFPPSLLRGVVPAMASLEAAVLGVPSLTHPEVDLSLMWYTGVGSTNPFDAAHAGGSGMDLISAGNVTSTTTTNVSSRQSRGSSIRVSEAVRRTRSDILQTLLVAISSQVYHPQQQQTPASQPTTTDTTPTTTATTTTTTTTTAESSSSSSPLIHTAGLLSSVSSGVMPLSFRDVRFMEPLLSTTTVPLMPTLALSLLNAALQYVPFGSMPYTSYWLGEAENELVSGLRLLVGVLSYVGIPLGSQPPPPPPPPPPPSTLVPSAGTTTTTMTKGMVDEPPQLSPSTSSSLSTTTITKPTLDTTTMLSSSATHPLSSSVATSMSMAKVRSSGPGHTVHHAPPNAEDPNRVSEAAEWLRQEALKQSASHSLTMVGGDANGEDAIKSDNHGSDGKNAKPEKTGKDALQSNANDKNDSRSSGNPSSSSLPWVSSPSQQDPTRAFESAASVAAAGPSSSVPASPFPPSSSPSSSSMAPSHTGAPIAASSAPMACNAETGEEMTNHHHHHHHHQQQQHHRAAEGTTSASAAVPQLSHDASTALRMGATEGGPAPIAAAGRPQYVHSVRKLFFDITMTESKYVVDQLRVLIGLRTYANQTFLPDSQKKLASQEECFLLLWKLIDLSPMVYQQFGFHPHALSYVVPLMEYAMDVRKNTMGYVHHLQLVLFVLLRLSELRPFCLQCNQVMREVVIPFSFPRLAVGSTTYHEFLFIALCTLLIEMKDPSMAAMLTSCSVILANMAPYTTSMGALTATRLANAFVSVSTRCQRLLALASTRASLQRSTLPALVEAYESIMANICEAIASVLQYSGVGGGGTAAGNTLPLRVCPPCPSLVAALLPHRVFLRALAELYVYQGKRQLHVRTALPFLVLTLDVAVGAATPLVAGLDWTAAVDSTIASSGGSGSPPAAAGNGGGGETSVVTVEGLMASFLEGNHSGSSTTTGTGRPASPSTSSSSLFQASPTGSTTAALASPTTMTTMNMSSSGTAALEAQVRLTEMLVQPLSRSLSLVGVLPTPHPLIVKRLQTSPAVEQWGLTTFWTCVFAALPAGALGDHRSARFLTFQQQPSPSPAGSPPPPPPSSSLSSPPSITTTTTAKHG